MIPKYFVTGNKNKLREVNEILDIKLEQIDIDLTEIQHIDVVEVVKEKAIEAYRKTGKPSLVEDTSLEFKAWNGFPGALIKWFLSTVNNEGILKMLSGEENRDATAKTAVGFYDGENVHVFLGELNGTMSTQVLGELGFGWDPIFIPEGKEKTLAEMRPEEKNRISMRKSALQELMRNK